jgi:hypothetical protein
MEFEYERLENRILLDNLKNDVIRKTLAYMIDFKEHDNLVVIPKPYSIEISNADICIAVIVFSGFEKEEYETLKTKNNYHVVSFNIILQTMFQSENIPIKYIDYMALFFMSLGRTNDTSIKDFLHLKNPSANETICRLRKEYLLKEIVWNYDLFNLLYKKTKMNIIRKKIKNKFTASMVFNGSIETTNDEKLKSISSSFIQEFNKKRELLVENGKKTNLDKKKPLLVGFGITSGNNRAKKAVELALSSLLYKNKIIENTKSILLLISSHTIEIDIDEIGIINDYIQEKSEYTADIVMNVNEDKNLGEALAVTIILSEIESTKN